jgi:polyhydroxyalkanoate synthesis regulator phasin
VSGTEGRPGEGGLSDALRSAVERTLGAAEASARAGSAALDPERRAELLDELVRRGRDARDELARVGQEAGAELSRRGQEARDELARRLELLERRLASVEELLRSQSKAKPED